MKLGTLVHHVNIYKTFPQHFSFLPRDFLQTEIRNWSAAARERDPNLQPGSRKSQPKLRVKGPVSEKFFELFFGSTGLWLAPRARQESCSCVRASTQVVECSTSKQLPCGSLVAWSPVKLCERSSEWTEQTDRLQACSSVMDRLVSQARI